jgi:hypothetical protein
MLTKRDANAKTNKLILMCGDLNKQSKLTLIKMPNDDAVY